MQSEFTMAVGKGTTRLLLDEDLENEVTNISLRVWNEENYPGIEIRDIDLESFRLFVKRLQLILDIVEGK